MDEPKSTWNRYLPCFLILGSPIAAAGLAHSVALCGHFLLPDVAWVIVGGAVMLRLNLLLAPIGSAVGALRVGKTLPIRIAVLIASIAFAVVAYLAVIALSFTFIPGYADHFGID